MDNLFKGRIQKLTWKEIGKEVAKVSPKFAQIIEELSPNDKYWVIKATYPYGSIVMKKALLQLPNSKGDIVPLTDLSIPSSIQEGLGYNLNSNPVCCVLKNSFEIFLPLEDRTIPLTGLIFPGNVFGASRIVNPNRPEQPAFIWDMTAGARTTFMLPKITEAKKHFSLKKAYHLTAAVPRSLMDHWEIFRQLAKHPKFQQSWEAEILYFPKQWFNHMHDDKWKKFYYYFLNSYWWGISDIEKNQTVWNLVFSLILKNYEARPSAYIMDTAKYLLHIGVGSFSGLAPACNNLAGPFEEIQRIYTEEYQLKNYPPIIMQPEIFDMRNPGAFPVYYSLQFPNALEFKPNARTRISAVRDLHETRSLLMRYEEELLSNKYNLASTSLYDLFRHVQYHYFHSGVELHKGMDDSSEIAREDARFLKTINGKVYGNFPDMCSFVKGCIRISGKNK